MTSLAHVLTQAKRWALPAVPRRLPVVRETPAYVVYRGPSRLNGAKVLGVVTGLGAHRSSNQKTGPMAQLYILVAGEEPNAALASGADEAVCGSCALRYKSAKASGGTYCYVTMMRGPLGVYRAHRDEAVQLEACADALCKSGLPLRLGAYGDPAALPEAVVSALVLAVSSAGHTGYTHDWRHERSAWLKPYAMASADSEADAASARAAGWRTFRIVYGRTPALLDGEVVCLAVTAGKHCADCQLCDGARDGDTRKVVAIPVHGRQRGASRDAANKMIFNKMIFNKRRD